MVQTGFVKPANAVLLDPKGNAMTQYADVKTATNVFPGRLVTRDTTDDQVKVNTGIGKAAGVAGYEMTPAAFKPATRDTVYAADDRLAVHSGSGFMFRGYLASNQTCVKGQALCDNDASGCLVMDSSGNYTAEESVTTVGYPAAIWVTKN